MPCLSHALCPFAAGSHVGIIIPDSVSKEDRDLFESVLMQMTGYREQSDLPSKVGEKKL